jgi:hypothetical protein
MWTRCWRSGASSRDVHWEQGDRGLWSGKWGVGGGRSEGWIPQCWPLKRHAHPPCRLPKRRAHPPRWPPLLHTRPSCLATTVARLPPGLALHSPMASTFAITEGRSGGWCAVREEERGLGTDAGESNLERTKIFRSKTYLHRPLYLTNEFKLNSTGFLGTDEFKLYSLVQLNWWIYI